MNQVKERLNLLADKGYRLITDAFRGTFVFLLGPIYRRFFPRPVSMEDGAPGQDPMLNMFASHMSEVTIRYFRTRLLACLAAGVAAGIGFMLMGLPFGWLIGIIVGVLNFVPFLSTIIGLPLCLIVAWNRFGDLSHLGDVVLIFFVISVITEVIKNRQRRSISSPTSEPLPGDRKHVRVEVISHHPEKKP